MIVLAIKSFFFSGADSYSLERKLNTSHFFLPFRGKMTGVVCAILAIAIEDLEMHLGNSNMPLSKSTIQFEPLAQKVETGK